MVLGIPKRIAGRLGYSLACYPQYCTVQRLGNTGFSSMILSRSSNRRPEVCKINVPPQGGVTGRSQITINTNRGRLDVFCLQRSGRDSVTDIIPRITRSSLRADRTLRDRMRKWNGVKIKSAADMRRQWTTVQSWPDLIEIASQANDVVPSWYSS